jgi:hypothetical protein
VVFGHDGSGRDACLLDPCSDYRNVGGPDDVLERLGAHYNTARPHQGMAQRVPDRDREVPGVTAVNLDVQRILRKPVLNGLINEYSRAA